MINLFVFITNEEQYKELLKYPIKAICTNNYELALQHQDIYYEIGSDETLDIIPTNLLANDTGIIYKYKDSHNIITNFNLNVANTATIKLLKENNVKYIGISLECSIKDLENLSFKDNIICYLYGRPKVMFLKEHPFLQDGDILKNINNKEYQVKKEKDKIVLYHYDVLDKREQISAYTTSGINNFYLHFTNESPSMISATIKSIMEK